MDSRRILITGLSSPIAGRLAQMLEREPAVQAIIGIDTHDPRHELEHTEFVRTDTRHGLLARIVRAASIDTVIDTRLLADPLSVSPRDAREINVLGTRGLLEACSGPDSSVRKLIFKSSSRWYGHEPDAPAFCDEEMPRLHRPRSAIEHQVVEAENLLASFAARNPRSAVTVLRAAAAIGAEADNAHAALLTLPIVPSVLGFDPRWQFIHEDDLVAALAHLARHRLAGTYNAAADGVLALSEIVSLLGKSLLPVLPPWGAGFAASQLRRLGLRVPVELVRELRFGQGVDNRRLKASGFRYRYTTREAVLQLRAHQRLRPLLRSGAEPYHYEPTVEEFLRWSPSVHRPPATDGNAHDASSPVPSYGDLSEEEVIAVAASLDAHGLEQLRRYEAAHLSRAAVLTALDRRLGRER